jgi:dolichol-phosphate mannosyltransferase
MLPNKNKIAVVVPAYRVKAQILEVVRAIGHEVDSIWVVDDACPEKSGEYVRKLCTDPRVNVVYLEKNLGVGGACLAGFHRARDAGADILVKVDGDGQMDPSLILNLTAPIAFGKADYVKGNRFFTSSIARNMPKLRFFGNTGLSFLAKACSGYWQIMDPTNGFLAFHSCLLNFLETEKISQRYFFENDLLFRMGLLRAVVMDFPMAAKYGEEKSSLSISKVLFSFPALFFLRFWKRIFYRYFLRDFNLGSIFLLLGTALLIPGGLFGFQRWKESTESGIPATSGTVMLAALLVLIGFQFLFSFLLFDLLSSPKDPVHPALSLMDKNRKSPES